MTLSPSDAKVEINGERIQEIVREGSGFWRSCSGCHETDEGVEIPHLFPYSKAFACHPGSGCSECGGIGVVWDDTDYADMAKSINAQEAAQADSAGDARQKVIDLATKIALGEWTSGKECTHLIEMLTDFATCIRAEALGWKGDDDKPLPEDAEIEAAHPVNSKSFKTHDEARRLVGARRSKGGLVALVNWLLYKTKPAQPQGDFVMVPRWAIIDALKYLPHTDATVFHPIGLINLFKGLAASPQPSGAMRENK